MKRRGNPRGGGKKRKPGGNVRSDDWKRKTQSKKDFALS